MILFVRKDVVLSDRERLGQILSLGLERTALTAGRRLFLATVTEHRDVLRDLHGRTARSDRRKLAKHVSKRIVSFSGGAVDDLIVAVSSQLGRSRRRREVQIGTKALVRRVITFGTFRRVYEQLAAQD